MAVIIPQVVTSDRASGAQVIDGSLKFDQTAKTYLTRTPGSAGNRKLWTLSYWIKFYGDGAHLFSANNDAFQFESRGTGQLLFANSGSTSSNTLSTALFRDHSQFYHVVIQHDAANTIARFYINGEQNFTATLTNADGTWNNATSHNINGRSTSIDSFSSFGMSQVYFVDGQALEPSEFGFTDPLTNTWKPKKYEGTFGTNGFWLPMDGNSPIGQDQSGQGNNWTPVNFGGSLELDNPNVSGARPILNTTQGGAKAGVGVFGSKQNVGYAVTVYDDGGGNKYYIDGVKQDTVTGLIRGATYTFDTSDSTVSSHPFRFSATSNGSHGGGSEYTNGVAAITGAATTITVPYNAPNTLYYYCTSHSGMGADITGITTNEKLADQYASNCVLALPLVGSKEDVVASIACTQTDVTVTNNGSVPFNSTQSNFYNGSAFFEDSSSDNLTYTNFGSRFQFPGDYTIEAWIYPTDSGAADGSIFVEYDGSNYFAFNFDPGTQFNIYNDSSSPSWSPTSGLPPANKWSHIALVRSGSTQTIYVNGNSIGTNSASGTHGYASPNFARIGGGASSGLDSYVQDVRVYNGIAKYTSNFVVPSTSPDILPDTPSGVSGGSKLAKITDGSFSSPDSRDALQVQDSDDLAFGTGEFTVEMFFYTNTVSGNDVLYDSRASTGSPTDGFSIVRNNDQLRTYTSGEYKITPSTFRVASNRWYHLAITRESTTQKMYIDGVLVGSATVSNDFSQPKATVGSDVNGSEEWDGFISSFRLIKGTALYTANFIPPFRALTNVTNTKLLCCQSNTSQTESTVIPDVTQFPAPYSAANKFSSIKYYTTVKQNQTSATTLPMSNPSHYQGNALDLASGGFQITTVNSAAEDFFMGMWVHFDTYATSKQFGVDIANNYVYFETQSSGAVKIRHTGDGGSTSSNTSLNDGNWHHIALSRTGNTLYGFVDGTAVVNDSGGLSGNNSVAANSKFNFWGADNNFTSYNIDGQIIDAFIYIGKGVSSYTTPTAPLVGSDGTINHYSGFTDSDAYFISPCVDVTGSSANSLSGFFKEVAGADTGSATNFNPFNTDINTVRGQETGYCTLNVLRERSGGYNPTFSDGNLFMDGRGDGTGTLSASSGKFYFEVLVDTVGTSGQIYLGVQDAAYGGAERGWSTAQIAAMRDTNALYGDGKTGSGATYGAGDLMSFAFDADNNKLYIAKNGVYMNGGNPSQGTGFTHSGINFAGGYTPIVSDGQTGQKFRANFGQKPFKFPPPDGFQPLNAANVRPVDMISRPDKFVTTVIGNFDTTKTHFTGFQPDMIWFKSRSNTDGHMWQDSVRGVNSYLFPVGHGAAGTFPQGGQYGVTSFNKDGWTQGSYGAISNSSMVAWCWKAGGNSNTFNIDDVGYASAAAAGLDGGTLTPSGASIGTKQGFSIIQWEGTNNAKTISHGLSQTPEFIINKNIDSTADYYIGSEYLGTGTWLQYLTLSTDAGEQNNSDVWQQGGAPNATTFGVGSVGNSTGTHIAYLWHSVPGVQKFGKYEGNGNANGPFVELGFRPSLVILKNIDNYSTGYEYFVFDSKRNTVNVMNKALKLELNATDVTADAIDFLSNGFKIRATTNGINLNAHTIVYMAFAEAPSVDLFGGGANAR